MLVCSEFNLAITRNVNASSNNANASPWIKNASINDCNTSLGKDKDAMNRVSTNSLLCSNWYYNLTYTIGERVGQSVFCQSVKILKKS
jgi:hypothetical protein